MFFKPFVLASLVAVALLMAIGCGGGDDDGTGNTEGASAAAPAEAQQDGQGDENDDGNDGGSSGAGGEGSSTPAQSGNEPTKKQFVKQANSICREREPEIVAGIEAYERKNKVTPGTSSEAKALAVVGRTVLAPATQASIDKLAALNPPAGEEEQVEEILAAMQEDLDNAKGQQIASLAEFGEGFARSDELAREYGIDSCTFSF